MHMEALYMLNYVIFSIFLSLFVIEVGIGVISLLAYDVYRSSIRRYLLPIWGMDGTFAVFYLVNLIATYPMLDSVIYAYIVPVLIGAFFFLLRNVFISYSEYIGDKRLEALSVKIYGLSTIMMAFVVLSVFTSGVSGIGISISQGSASINLLYMLVNPFNILMFIVAALIALFIVGSYFGFGPLSRLKYVMLPLAMLIAIASIYLYVPYVFSSIASEYYLLAVSIALMLVSMALTAKGSRLTRYSALLWILVSINLFGIAQYPGLMGGQLHFTDYITGAAGASAIALLTAVCGSFLAIAIALFIYISYVKK